MAKAPTKQEVEKLVAKATAQDEKKTVSQTSQGKEFVNRGQGVIPEAVWKNLPGKKLNDPKATA